MTIRIHVPKESRGIRRMLRAIAKTGRLSKEEASRMLNVCGNWGGRKVKKILEKSFRDITTGLRMQAAEQLLGKCWSVSEVAGYLHYKETSSFRKTFKRATGVWPRTNEGAGEPTA